MASWYIRTLVVLLIHSQAVLADCTYGNGTATFTMSSPAQATSLGSCGNLKGNLLIDSSVWEYTDYNISGLSSITGNLTLNNVPFGRVWQAFDDPGFVFINDTYSITGTASQFASFLSPRWVSRWIEIDYNPSPLIPVPYRDTSISDYYPSTVYSSVHIQNTSRTYLTINVESAETTVIQDNSQLTEVALSGDSISNLVIKGNGYARTFNATSPNNQSIWLGLSSALQLGNTEIHGISGSRYDDTMDFAGLSNIKGDLRLINNTFDTLQLLSVASVQGTLQVSNNAYLGVILLPLLNHIFGDVEITNNIALWSAGSSNWTDSSKQPNFDDSLVNFPSLKYVNGSIHIDGAFKDFRFPSLSSVGGSMVLKTSANMSCAKIDSLYRSNIAKDFYCSSGNESVGAFDPSNTTDTTITQDDSHPGLTSGAKAGIGVGVAIVVLVILAGVVWCWHRLRSRRRSLAAAQWISRDAKVQEDEPTYEKPELSAGDPRYEMEGDQTRLSVIDGKQELPAKHGFVEVGQRTSDDSEKKGTIYEAPGDETYIPTKTKTAPRVSTRQSLATDCRPTHLTTSAHQSPELRTPETPSDRPTGRNRSGSAISPISSASARGSRVAEGISPMTPPAAKNTEQFTDRPVSTMSAAEDKVQSPQASTARPVADTSAKENTALLSSQDHRDHAKD